MHIIYRAVVAHLKVALPSEKTPSPEREKAGENNNAAAVAVTTAL